MKNLITKFSYLLLFLLISSTSLALDTEIIRDLDKWREKIALKGIPGVADASWAQDISLWVVMTDPNAGHNFDQMGSMICNGAVSNFSVSKGYTITFWNIYTKKPITKFQCY